MKLCSPGIRLIPVMSRIVRYCSLGEMPHHDLCLFSHTGQKALLVDSLLPQSNNMNFESRKSPSGLNCKLQIVLHCIAA